MKAIGGVETVAGAHFVERAVLLAFLDEMAAAASLEAALQRGLGQAEPPPRPRPLRVALPEALRHPMLRDLPGNITLEPGRLEIRATGAEAMLESLAVLATILQNDLDRFAVAIQAPPNAQTDADLAAWLERVRTGPDERGRG